MLCILHLTNNEFVKCFLSFPFEFVRLCFVVLNSDVYSNMLCVLHLTNNGFVKCFLFFHFEFVRLCFVVLNSDVYSSYVTCSSPCK